MGKSKTLKASKQMMVSSFLEIAVGQTTDTARQFLSATNWRLEEAIQLYLAGNEGKFAASSSSGSRQGDEDEVRAPLPVIRDSLYGDAYNFDEEMEETQVWDGEQGGGASTTHTSQDNLAAFYRPPFGLMYQGSFEQAKVAAASVDKWLIVNVQSNKEFTSHMLNRDTWANEGVGQTIETNFIFWQMYDDTTEGMKVCNYYKAVSAPVTIIIDPITGQKIRLWSGMVHPGPLFEALLPLMESGPRSHCVSHSHKRRRKCIPSPMVSNDEVEELRRAIEAASMEGVIRCSYPPLPDEPKGEKSVLCRVGFRLPDGRRVERNFLHSDPIQLMWSFIYSQLGEDKDRTFRLAQVLIPGSSASLDYDTKVTIGDSGLSNSMIYVTWV